MAQRVVLVVGLVAVLGAAACGGGVGVDSGDGGSGGGGSGGGGSGGKAQAGGKN
jgi:hypothetical protein